MFDAECDLAALAYGPEQDPDAVRATSRLS
jgi:hypothetical protein